MPRSPAIDEFKRATAKRLRQNATDAEQCLWCHLKRLETRGTHFRRQMPIGNYVVDFACPAARLAIEIDGSHHGDDHVLVRDEKRTRWLEAEGYRVLRFWNNDVTKNLASAMEMIYATLYGSPNAATFALKHARHRRSENTKLTPPPRAGRADPPPPGEGEESA
jgi:very-short-patch-repair endonuclease